jgi:uncharacterized protein YbjQ (UPF0145 family)
MMRSGMSANVTTTPSIEGWEIDAYLGPLAVHRVAGTGIFSDVFADFSDFFGGRSESYRHQLESLYSEAVTSILRQAEMRGGNFVVGLRVDFDEISGKGKQMFMLVMTGTAVRARQTSARILEPDLEGAAVTGDEVAAVMGEQRLIAQLGTGSALESKDWEFLASRRVSEAISYAVRLLPLKPSTVDDQPEDRVQRESIYYYLRSLPAEVVSDAIYATLEADSANRSKALAALQELNLLRYDLVLKLLGSASPDTRHAALQSIAGSAHIYRADHMHTIGAIIDQLSSAFAPRATTMRKSTFGGDKPKWLCVCENWVSPGETCGRCFRNQLGFRQNDLSPDRAREILAARLQALKEIFRKPALD